MKRIQKLDSTGVGHIVVVFGVVVLLAVGFSGWWVLKNNGGEKSLANTAIQEALKNAKCEYEDKDLCKFFASWEASEHYTVVSEQTIDDKSSTSTLRVEGENIYMKSDGEYAMENIIIGDTTYTKDTTDGKWWKQTRKADEPTSSDIVTETKDTFDVKEPTKEEVANSYKKLGKEACGDLTCFKYQFVDPSDTEVEQYLWFDDKDYQLRRSQTNGPDTSYDATYSYEKVSVKAPANTKELGPNQYIVPGQSEPMTMPSQPTEAEMEALMRQYQ